MYGCTVCIYMCVSMSYSSQTDAYLHQKGYSFTIICMSTFLQDYVKTATLICMTLNGMARNGPGRKYLN